MLHNLGWQLLHEIKENQRLVLFYKIINGLTSVDTKGILLPADSHTRANPKYKFKHLQVQSNCEAFGHNFSPATIASWNSLPFDSVKAVSVSFKLGLN